MHAIVHGLARFFALLGGVTLTALILMVCVSVLGRSLNGMLHSDLVQNVAPGFAAWALGAGVGPVNGDFEILEAGIAFAIFAFLPVCQLSGAHASVDIFTSKLPDRVNRGLRFVTEVVFAAVLILIAWQLLQGGLSKYRSGQTTLLLEFPVWWSYAASVVAMGVASLVGVYVAAQRVAEAITGASRLAPDEGAEP